MNYGYCPECGAPGVERERRPFGFTTCKNGHKHPHYSFKADLKGEGDAKFNIYLVRLKKTKLAVLVIAHGSEDALRLINHSNWSLKHTTTNRLYRNVSGPSRVLTGLDVHAKSPA